LSINDRSYSWRVWRDKFAAAYSTAAFERTARRYFNGPKSARLGAVLGVVLAVMMLLGAGALFETAAKSLYLEACGVEAQGRMTGVSFHTSFANHKYVEWKKIDYEFTTSSGETVTGQLDRPGYELANLPEAGRLTVRYWDRFPAINTPLGVKDDFSVITLVGAILLLGGLHFGCLSTRLLRWRRRPVATPENGANP
jgi:hypothetical protein